MFFRPKDSYRYDRFLKKRCGRKKRKYVVHDHGGPDVYDHHAPVKGKWQVFESKK